MRGKALQIEVFCLIACALAWSLIAGCEYFILKDNYQAARMNTLFKIHFPAWLLMGVALPPLLYHAAKRLPKTPQQIGAMVPALLILLIALAGPAYTLTAFMGIKEERVISLNGLGYMEKYNPNLYKIIQWLDENADRDAVLLELPGGGYELDSMASAATGRQSLLGWRNHEYVWRDAQGDKEIGDRFTEVMTVLTATDWSQAQPILDKHGVDYVVVARPNNQEMQNALAKIIAGAFRQRLEPVIQEAGPYELYRVPQSSAE